MIRLITALLTLIFIFFVAFTFKKAIDKTLRYAVIILPIASLLFIIATFPDILHGTASDATWMVFVLSIIGIISSIKLYIDARQSIQRSALKQSETDIFHVIRHYEGRVTPIEIALKTDFTVAEAEQKLNVFCEQGIAEREITPSGKVVYVFSGFMSTTEKKQAQDPMAYHSHE